MGWRGASDLAALMYVFNIDVPRTHVQRTFADGDLISGVLYFFGGTLQVIACILEFILGNTFPCIVFGTFGESPFEIPSH